MEKEVKRKDRNRREEDGGKDGKELQWYESDMWPI